MEKKVNEVVPTISDLAAVEASRRLDSEERSVLTKEMALYLGAFCTPDELISTAERVGHLYWKASVIDAPFTHAHVDIFAAATLIALEQHPEETTALRGATRIIRGRAASRNEAFGVSSPLGSVGIANRLAK